MRSKNKLSLAQKDKVLRLLIDRYASDPASVETLLPEVSRLIATVVPRPLATPPFRVAPLTPGEQQARLNSYVELTKRLGKKMSPFSKEEAVQALEHAASLLEGFFDESIELDRDILKKLIRIATGVSLSSKGKARQSLLREGEPARTVTVLRGVRLNLSWDKKLLSVEVDPRQLALRARALAFVGVGHDSATDVAAHHNDYFVEAALER